MSSNKTIFSIASLFASTLLLFTACHNTPSDPIQLSFNPTAGNVYLYHIVAEVSMSGIERGREQFENQKTDMRIKMTAIENTDDGVQVEVAFQSMAIDNNSSRSWGNIQMNTEDIFDVDLATVPEDELELFKAQKERMMTFSTPMIITFATDGSVQNVDMTKIINRIDSLHSEEDSGLASQAFFNENNIKQMFEGFFRIFPNNEVRIGDSWSSGNVVSSFPDVTIRYTLASISGNNILINKDSLAIEREIGTLEFSIDTQGEIELDIYTGMIIRTNFEGNFLFADESEESTGEGVVRLAITLEQ